MKKRSSVLAETVTFAGSSYLFQAIAMARGFAVALFLGPALYGLWTLFRTFLSSGRFLGLGATQAMMREVPLNRGRGEGRANHTLQQVCFTWYLLAAVVVALATLGAALTGKFPVHGPEGLLVGLVYVLNGVWLFTPAKLISEKKIILLSRVNILYILLNTLCGLSLMLLWQINGLLIGMLLANGAVLLLLRRRGELSFRLHFDFPLLARLVRTGFPLMLLASTFFCMQTIDKLIVFSMLGTEYMGYFGLAAFVTEIIGHIPGSIATVLFPRMMHALGQARQRREIEHYYTEPVLLLAAIMPFLLGLVWINIDLPVVYFLPQYLPAVEILRIFILGLFFFAAWGVPRGLLIALNKELKLLAVVLVLILTGAIADVLVIRMGYGMRGVALVSVAFLGLLTVMANSYALLCLGRNAREIGVFLLRLYAPFGYVLAGLYLLTLLPPSESVLLGDFARSGYFVLYSLPPVFYLQKRLDLTRLFQRTSTGQESGARLKVNREYPNKIS